MTRNQWTAFSGMAVAALAAVAGAFYYSDSQEQPRQATATQASAPPAPPMAEAPKAATEAPAALQDQAAQPPQPSETAVAVAKPPAAAAEPPAAPPSGEQAPPPKEILPAFDTVRVEKTGEAVIAGRAEPGSHVSVKFNGEVVGTATANVDGTFAVVPEKPLAQGSGVLTLEMNKDGKVTTSEDSVVVAVKENAPALVAKLQPAAPTKVTQVPAPVEGAPPDEVQLNVVEYDSAGNIVFSGRAKPGTTVRFYIDNALTGDAVAGEGGEWQYLGGAVIAPGEHVLRADQLNESGKVVSRIELPFFREKPEVAAAANAAPPAAPPPGTVASTAPVQASAPPKPGTRMASAELIVPERLVIQPGHNLWRLSRQIYGRGTLYTVIYEANRDQLRNPNRIYPGQILAAPAVRAN